MKKAIIFGVTGQDGSHLADLLLLKEYSVLGVARRTSTDNTGRIKHLQRNPNFQLVQGDITDSHSIIRILSEHADVDEIYNLAAQSHVGLSFECPEYTAETDALGPLRILEAIKILGLQKKTKVY